MATKRFDIGDEVCLFGTVRLVDAAGDGTVTVELGATGQRVTVQADSSFVLLQAKAKAGAGFSKAPKGRQGKLIPAKE